MLCEQIWSFNQWVLRSSPRRLTKTLRVSGRVTRGSNRPGPLGRRTLSGATFRSTGQVLRQPCSHSLAAAGGYIPRFPAGKTQRLTMPHGEGKFFTMAVQPILLPAELLARLADILGACFDAAA